MSFTVSIRLSKSVRSVHDGQRSHDLRIGKVPDYVDSTRTLDNEVVVPPPTSGDMVATIKARRQSRFERGEYKREPRTLRKDAVVALEGLISFGTAAQPIINSLCAEDQVQRYQQTADAVAVHLGTDLAGLVIHRDESAPHAHFCLYGFAPDGLSVASRIDKGALSKTQDVGRESYADLGITRGKGIGARIQDGEPRYKTVHRSVKELHHDLPIEIAEARAEVDENRKNALEAEARAEAAEAKVVALHKRASVADQERMDAERNAEVLNQERVEAERGAARALDELETLKKRVEAYDRQRHKAEEEAKAAQAEIERLDEIHKRGPKTKEATVLKRVRVQERGILGNKTVEHWEQCPLTYIEPQDAKQWRGGVLRKAKERMVEADRRVKKAERMRRDEEQARMQAQSDLFWLEQPLMFALTAEQEPSAYDAALWASQAELTERFGVQMQVSNHLARVPPQARTEDSKIATALYREGYEQGWAKQWFNVPIGVALVIIEHARKDDRLECITFQDSNGEATAALEQAISDSRVEVESDLMGDVSTRRSSPSRAPQMG